MLQDIASSKSRYVSQLSLIMQLDQGGKANYRHSFLDLEEVRGKLAFLGGGRGTPHNILICVAHFKASSS